MTNTEEVINLTEDISQSNLIIKLKNINDKDIDRWCWILAYKNTTIPKSGILLRVMNVENYNFTFRTLDTYYDAQYDIYKPNFYRFTPDDFYIKWVGSGENNLGDTLCGCCIEKIIYISDSYSDSEYSDSDNDM